MADEDRVTITMSRKAADRLQALMESELFDHALEWIEDAITNCDNDEAREWSECLAILSELNPALTDGGELNEERAAADVALNYADDNDEESE